MGQCGQTFPLYFSITTATVLVFGHLLQFRIDFKEHLVALINDFYPLRKLFLKMSHFYPTQLNYKWGKNETP